MTTETKTITYEEIFQRATEAGQEAAKRTVRKPTVTWEDLGLNGPPAGVPQAEGPVPKLRVVMRPETDGLVQWLKGYYPAEEGKYGGLWFLYAAPKWVYGGPDERGERFQRAWAEAFAEVLNANGIAAWVDWVRD